MWQTNEEFWKDKKLPMRQEIIFASTGAKLDWQPEDYYARELVGSDIQTNPPETNQWIAEHDVRYERTVDRMPPKAILDELEADVEMQRLEDVLMEEGIAKFAKPQKKLLETVKEKRAALGKK
jgi:transaldolase